jgi:aminoglycoside phosphotransferase (APT) family kinase protein
MELARGRSYANGALPDFDPETRRHVYEQMIDTLADLHCVDAERAGLGDFGKPGNYFVHGDYRIDNVLFDGDGTLSAVLDWELATLGDPLADFSYFAMQWAMPADGGAGLDGLDLEALGIPTMAEIVERYCDRSRVPVAAKLDWYFAYNLFRLAGIVQGIKKRVIDGTASNANAAEMAKRVPMLAQAAWRFAERAGS